MNSSKAAAACLLLPAVILSGCVSATPRPYAPLVQPPPADPAAFEHEFAACGAAVAAGKRNFGQSGAAIVVGGVGGVAAVQVLGGVAATASIGGYGAATLAASGLGLALLVPVATYSLSSARRRRNEQEIQKAMTACLAQSGHAVSGWSRVSRREAASMKSLTPTRPATRPD